MIASHIQKSRLFGFPHVVAFRITVYLEIRLSGTLVERVPVAPRALNAISIKNSGAGDLTSFSQQPTSGQTSYQTTMTDVARKYYRKQVD